MNYWSILKYYSNNRFFYYRLQKGLRKKATKNKLKGLQKGYKNTLAQGRTDIQSG